jgi:hypothetical protein
MRSPSALGLPLLALLLAFLAPLAGGVAGVAAQSASIVVEDWAQQPEGKTGIPDGWKRQDWGSPRYDFRIVAESPVKVLHLKSDKDGSTISKELKVDVKQYPYLTWRWKAVVLPKGGDSRAAATDDQACQVYVTFPRFPTAVRSRVIGYVWDTTAPAGTVVTSPKTSTVTYVVLRSGAAEVGRWLTETRNVLEDFRAIHKEAPSEEVGAVSISIDSNDVKDRAECFVGAITFRKQP